MIRLGGGFTLPISGDSTTPRRLDCREPIAQVSISDLDAKDTATRAESRRRLREILEYWIRLENDALAWKANHIPAIPIVKYETNKRPYSVPNLLTIGSVDDLQTTVRSLDTIMFATHRCADLAGNDHSLSDTERDAIQSLSTRAIDFSHFLDDLLPNIPTPKRRLLRMIYRID